MKNLMRIVPALTLVLWAGSCGNDDTVSPTQGVNVYLTSLPPWSEFEPSQPDDSTFSAPQPPSISTGSDGQQYGCISRQATLTKTPEDIVIYSPDSEILYLGSLLTGDGYVGGIGTLEELPIRQRAPLTISIDILSGNNTRVVPDPTVATVKQAIGELIQAATDAQHVAGSYIVADVVESYSAEQGALSLGLSARYMGASVRTRLNASRTVEQSSLQIRFLHRMFTTSMVLPQTPGELFSDAFTEGLLQEQVDLGRIGPDNVPAYVSSITWGRMLIATMTSSYTRKEMQTALNAGYEAAKLGVQMDMSTYEGQVLQDSEIKIVAIGGDATAVEGMIQSGNLKDYFNQTAPLTTAVPLSYTVRSLSDNAIAYVSETTKYTLQECLNAVYFDDEVEWNNAVRKLGATIHKLDTNRTGLMKTNEVTSLSANQALGLNLTWDEANTGIPTQVVLCAYQGSGFVCEDNELRNGAAGWLSVGDVDNYENDDFAVEVNPPSGVDVFAIGLTVGDNSLETGEMLSVFDEGDILLKEFTSGLPGTGNGGQVFMGVVSGIPLSRIFFDESSGGDDMGIRDLRIGAVEW